MRLGVNIDHVATLRQARRGTWPDPVEAALICERAGAQRIVCHLREDRRHIQDADMQRLKEAVTVPLNLEMSIAPEIVEAALALKPAQVTLVPERRQELTTEGGLDAMRLSKKLSSVIDAFKRRGIDVSLFIDPVERQLKAAQALSVPIIELHTGRYADAATEAARSNALAELARAAAQGRALGLAVAAGHGLDYRNVQAVTRLSEIEELNIGFSIIARALEVGLERAVTQMLGLLQRRDAHALHTI